MFAAPKSKRSVAVVWQPLLGFSEVAPNVWLPDGYDPSAATRPRPGAASYPATPTPFQKPAAFRLGTTCHRNGC